MSNTGSEQSVDIEKYKVIRDRWDREDTLLMSRTGAFLTTNSILFAALGFQAQNRPFQIGVAIIGLSLSILWLTTSMHSFNILGTLFQLCINDMPYGLGAIYKIRPVLFRPATVFCKLVPGLIVVGWLAYIVWTIVQK